MGVYSNISYANKDIDRELEEALENYDGSSFDIMEACIAIHENDMKLFDTLIECDFLSAVNEMQIRSLREDGEEAAAKETEKTEEAGDKKKAFNIWEQIKKIFNNVIGWIKKAFATVVMKIKEIFKADKKFIDSVAKHMKNPKNMEGFKGISNFAYPKLLSTKDIDTLKDYMNELNSELKDSNPTLDELVKAGEQWGEYLKNNKMEAKTEDYFEEKQETWIPTSHQLTEIVNAMTASDPVAILKVKELSSSSIEVMKTIESKINSLKDKEDAKKANEAYKIASKATKVISKGYSLEIKMRKQQLKALRVAFFICGKYAAKKAGATVEGTPADMGDEKEELKESVLFALESDIIRESSDLYIDNCFGF